MIFNEFQLVSDTEKDRKISPVFQLVTEKDRKISPVFQLVTEKERKIWPLSQLVTKNSDLLEEKMIDDEL